ncbi:MAG TPA: tRNA epoxyqueuosine(34) reductase QueG [Bacteroidota bacterium]|nr:tRNA epoxyqueuosine(34) reductase QueG [Bacteroidota bacterium]
MDPLTEEVKRKGKALGFTSVGIAVATALDEESAHLEEWLDRGYQASMAWMARTTARRTDPRLVLPGARSVIAVALNYYDGTVRAPDPGAGKISRYAWGDDYHDVVGEKLEQLRDWVMGLRPGVEAKVYVDTGPVMEKAWAARSGIGWLGKHANVITREVGSWVFLGEVLTTLELEPDLPALDRCGTCTRCITACPTGAIVEPYVVDSNLCLSYLTIEHRGPVAEGLHDKFDGWIYGCDVCQDVCPWNVKFALEEEGNAFAPREGFEAPPLERWHAMDQSAFSSLFRRSPVKRAKLEGLRRNIGIVLNGADPGRPLPSSHQ